MECARSTGPSSAALVRARSACTRIHTASPSSKQERRLLTGYGPAKFGLGQIVSTPQAIRFCGDQHIDIFDLLLQHATGDWGDLSSDDQMANESALVDGSRILSSYTFQAGKVWVLTEAKGDDGNRAFTCLMLPSDY